MSGEDLRSRLGRILRQPSSIPARLKRRLDEVRRNVESSRIVWPEAGRARLETLRLPSPRGGDVLVRTQISVVSPGTERAQFNGRPNTSIVFPYHPGYSGCGVVLAAGEKAGRLVPGMRVAGPLAHSGMSLLPAEQLTVVPEQISDTQAAFTQLGLIALHGVHTAAVRPGDRVVVLGTGLIGQLLIQLLAAAGAFPIIALHRSDRDRDLSREHGAHETFVLGEIQSQLQADVTFDVTGSPDAVHDAIRCSRRGGRIVLLGSNRGMTKGLDLQKIRDADLTLLGAHVTTLPQPATRAQGSILGLLRDGRLRVEKLVTHEIVPAEAELFYRRLAAGQDRILAALFRWDRLPARRSFDPDPHGPRSSRDVPRHAAPSASTTKSLRIGLIGCGEIAVENARAVHQATNASLVMAMDVDAALAADLAGEHGIASTTEIDELLTRSDVDAVLISTPHFLHAPLAIRAAEHGKHVIVEKPMAISTAEADAMIDACRRSRVHLSVLYCQRYLPYVQKAKSLIDGGAMGTLLGFHLLHYLDRPLSYWSGGRTGRVSSDWRLSRAQSGGGMVVFNLVHFLDLLRYLTAMEVTSVHADLARLESPADSEDAVSITLRYEDRLIGNVTAGTCVRGANLDHQELRLWGTEGHLVVAEPFRFYSLHQVDGYAPGQWHTLTDWEWGIERRTFIERFASAVLRNDEPDVTAEDGRAVQVVTDAIYTSGETHRVVTLGAT